MSKLIMIALPSAVLIRVADNQFYNGKFTDAFVSMMRDILRAFGV